MTKVIFYLKDSTVLAYFPDLVFNSVGNKTCYTHIGQHSACSEQYIKELREANYNEYQFLLSELIGQGYKDFLILNSQTFNYMRNPTQAEILFGHGATHYRDFTLAEIGLNKQGKIKRKFKADDNLFYHL